MTVQQTIVNVRNELATEHTVDMQAKTKGISPTTQLLNSAAKKGMGPVGKTFQKLGDVVGHAGALYADKPLINAGITAWQVTRPMREARKAAKVDAEINALNEARKAELLSQENRLAPYVRRQRVKDDEADRSSDSDAAPGPEG